MDLSENRARIREISAIDWKRDIGHAIIDEAQKEPAIFEKIKYAYDANEISFSALLGSSQILLLKKIRESLAGRISIYELYPFMMGEICVKILSPLQPPLIDQLITNKSFAKILQSVPGVLFETDEARKKDAEKYLLQWGGMPALFALNEAQEKQKWLKDYEFTYLEKDLADLARINDLEPFRTFQKLAALRTGNLLNYSELSRDTGISVDSSKRYLEYLKLSYQTILLQPYYKNLTSSTIKTPKIYWLDIGILRQLTGFTGQLTGAIYETMVVSELYKWVKTMQRSVELYFYRTKHGLEVDLILQTPHGIIGAEIKSRDNITSRDISGLKEISNSLKNEWLGGIVIYRGNKIEKIAEPNIWAIPSWRLFTP